MTFKSLIQKLSIAPAMLIAVLLTISSAAMAVTDLAQSPMITLKTAPGLVMLTMGRDLPLYRAAFNDVNDIDGDGVPDIYFKPGFKYDGYFAYDRCYTSDNATFTPVKYGDVVEVDAKDTSKNYYKCPGQWSGNFLNWVTMARIDVIRKVLYGGKRSTDTTGNTILERTYVPQESTIWGKEYASFDRDGYNITDYTPLSQPSGTVGVNKHMFANVTLQGTDAIYSASVGNPLMIVYTNRTGRIWDLVSAEQLILGTNPTGTNIAKHVVRVSTCVKIDDKYEEFCVGYPKDTGSATSYKPTGLLHKYGETNKLAFGLISGTYDNNYSGGVLRQNIDNFSREVDPTNGRFYTEANPPLPVGTPAPYGIVHHLDAFRPWGFGNSTWGGEDYTKWNFNSVPYNGDNPMWGNPLGEMMFEGLNYFSGGSATPAFTTGVGSPRAVRPATTTPFVPRAPARTSPESASKLNLKQPAWLNPYSATTAAKRTQTAAYPSCAKPIQMTIGDPKTSFDSDLPGSAFSINPKYGSSTVPTLTGLDVSAEADLIWTDEALGSKNYFIGEALGFLDLNPTAKPVSSFKNIRGHAPDSTANEGSFYGASVARFGQYSGVSNPAFPSTKKLQVEQISIALDSHVPQIKIPMQGGKTVSILLISKNIKGFGLDWGKDKYHGTGAITAFFIDTLANTNPGNQNPAINGGNPYYKFRVSFSDIDQGGDNESDAKVTYEIKLNAPIIAGVSTADKLTIGMEYFESTTSVEMHIGYVIGGTSKDGIYLDVGGGTGFGAPPPLATEGYYLDTVKDVYYPVVLPATVNATWTNIATRLPRSTLDIPADGAPLLTKNARDFSVGPSATGEFIPHDMLWYAAKYGARNKIIDPITGAISYTLKLKPNGEPANYYFANNPSLLATQMGQAFQDAAAVSLATTSAVASSGVKVSGGNLVYQASYDTVRWGGEIRAFAVLNSGNISNDESWIASTVQPAPDSRNVVLGRATTSDRTAKSGSLNASSHSTLTPGVGGEQLRFKDAVTFRYLLGDRSNEISAGGKLRNRSSAMGDIVNSDPLYIGKEDFTYLDAGYNTFKASEPKLLGIGSNDGFYRLLDSTTGIEKLAFIPKTISANMEKLADPNYTHQYFVDGPSSYGHVNFGDATTPGWNGVVAASLGAGGKAIFALNATASDLASSNNGVLWEVEGSTSGLGANIGFILNKPIVAQLKGATGKPAVITGNGINSAIDKAALIVLDAQTGAELAKCIPTDSANAVGNGMTSIAAVKTDGKVDLVYAADYNGNIWRINPNDSNCGPGAVKVFSAKDAGGKVQPITGDITVLPVPSPKNGYMLLFGTGKYSGAADPSNKDVQTLYGVWDANTSSATTNSVRGNLVGHTFGTYNSTTKSRLSSKTVPPAKAWFDEPGKEGWYIDLTCSTCPTGERFIDKPLLPNPAKSNIAFFLSYVPSDDLCEVGGDGWITGIDAITGDYAKAYAGTADNSVLVDGAAPRGLFIVTKAAVAPTGNGSGSDLSNLAGSDEAEIIYVGRNKDSDTVNPTGFDKTGSDTCVGPNCIDTVGGELEPFPKSPNLGRRLVWRQIQ